MNHQDGLIFLGWFFSFDCSAFRCVQNILWRCIQNMSDPRLWRHLRPYKTWLSSTRYQYDILWIYKQTANLPTFGHRFEVPALTGALVELCHEQPEDPVGFFGGKEVNAMAGVWEMVKWRQGISRFLCKLVLSTKTDGIARQFFFWMKIVVNLFFLNTMLKMDTSKMHR